MAPITILTRRIRFHTPFGKAETSGRATIAAIFSAIALCLFFGEEIFVELFYVQRFCRPYTDIMTNHQCS